MVFLFLAKMNKVLIATEQPKLTTYIKMHMFCRHEVVMLGKHKCKDGYLTRRASLQKAPKPR